MHHLLKFLILQDDPFLKVAFAAISTGLSVAALANLLMEFPVIGAMTIQSSGFFGPNGSASTMVETTFSPASSSIFLIHSSPVPKRVAAVNTEWVTIGTTVAPASAKICVFSVRHPHKYNGMQ